MSNESIRSDFNRTGFSFCKTYGIIVVMPEAGPQFESPEDEIASLEKRLAEKRAELAHEEVSTEHETTQVDVERQHLREEIQRHISETPHPSVPVLKGASDAMQGQPQQQQVTMLLELALEKGVVHAVKVAEELNDPYLLDRLHDELVDHFYEKMLQKEAGLRKL